LTCKYILFFLINKQTWYFKSESALIKIIGSSDVTLTRPNDSLLLEHVSFKALFGTFAVTSVLQIFCSLLLERRFIFLSSSLAKLSQVANAAVALLYPFEWQVSPEYPFFFLKIKNKSNLFLIACIHPHLAGQVA